MLTHVHRLYSHRATGIYLSISLGSLLTPLSAAVNLAQRNYTTLAGTHLHLGEVKQSQVNFLLRISSAPGGVRTRDLSIPKRASYLLLNVIIASQNSPFKVGESEMKSAIQCQIFCIIHENYKNIIELVLVYVYTSSNLT
jgi:hypothetical protein